MLEKTPDASHERALLHYAYRFIFFTMVIAYVMICILAVYAVSVLDRNDVVRQIDTNVNAITAYLDQGSETSERIQEEFLDEYRTKTRVISMMLQDTDALEENETILEEIRVTVGADEVSVFSDKGNIVASTATYNGSVSIDPQFQKHMHEKNYNDAILYEQEEHPYVAAAAQLADRGYFLQITFDAQSLVSLIENASISSVAKNFPLYSDGNTAILDSETLTYLSHTDQSKIGMACSIDAEQFHKNKGKFDTVLSGDTIMVRYHKYDGYIIAAFVSYDDIFHASYTVLGWMISGGVVILTVTALAMRMATIRALRKYDPEAQNIQSECANTDTCKAEEANKETVSS